MLFKPARDKAAWTLACRQARHCSKAGEAQAAEQAPGCLLCSRLLGLGALRTTDT